MCFSWGQEETRKGTRGVEREVAGSCTELCCCTGNTLSALCKKELHLSFLRVLTAFQKRFIQGQIGISVTANHRGHEQGGTVSWDLTLLGAHEMGRGQQRVLLHTPGWRDPGLHQGMCSGIYLALHRYVELPGLCPCRLESLPCDQSTGPVTARVQSISF